MKKLYTIVFLLFISFPLVSFAGSHKAAADNSGTIIIQLDESNYTNININKLYVVFDKYDRTGAGVIKQQLTIDNGRFVINDVPEGKYFVDIYTAGAYRQHFSMVMKTGNKISKYKLVLDAVVYVPSLAKDKTTISNDNTAATSLQAEETIVAKN
jgi:hypothetical protein